MWLLKKDFTDYVRKDNKGYFYANPDKSINPYNRDLYPITWKGILNDESVEIIQLTDSKDIDDFKFMIYPEKLTYLKSELINYIHQYLDFSMR